MTMLIRAAKAADCAAILAFWNPIIRDTAVTFSSQEKTLQDLRQMLDDKAKAGHGFLVADLDGQVVGFATYGQFRAGVGYAHTMEHTVILSPKTQGRGIGRALMTAIEDHARRAGAHSIFAGVSMENPDAVAFHSKLGYSDGIVLPKVGFKFGRWMDLKLMQKFL